MRGLLLISETGGGAGGGRFTIQSDQADNFGGWMRWGAPGSTNVLNDSQNGSNVVVVMNSIITSAGLQVEFDYTLINNGIASNITMGFAQAISDPVASTLLLGSRVEILKLA